MTQQQPEAVRRQDFRNRPEIVGPCPCEECTGPGAETTELDIEDIE